MNLVMIYGAPGVGKLTVAKELAAMTGYRLFHNHLSLNCVSSVFDFDARPFWELVHQIRFSIFEAAARESVDMIFTFVYALEEDDDFVRRVYELIERHGSRVCSVQLVCDKDVLERRVQAEERAQLFKINTAEGIRSLYDRYEMFTVIRGHESLSIDNTDVAPEEAAGRIAAHYALPVIEAQENQQG